MLVQRQQEARGWHLQVVGFSPLIVVAVVMMNLMSEGGRA